MIYFDNAASSFPKPYEVTRKTAKWIMSNGANPGRSGHKPSLEAAYEVFDTRCEIADFIGVDKPENIVFVPNATYGINILLQGLLKRGDHIVTTDLEHNSVLRPVHYMYLNRGIRYDVAEIDLYDDKKTVENILSLIRKNTKYIVCTQCSNVCGNIMPLKSISESLPNDVGLIVDGSQGAGTIEINLTKDRIDYYCAPSHKGLFGIQGSGFIALNSKNPEPVFCGGTGSDSMLLEQPRHLPDAFESGTLATPAIVSMKCGINYINSVGLNKIFDHKKRLTEYLFKRLKDMDKSILYVDCERASFAGVAIFNIKNRVSDEVAGYLSDNGICVRSGFHCAPLAHKKFKTEDYGAVRVSFGHFNTFEEIDQMIKLLKYY